VTEILNIKTLNPMAAIVAVGKDEESSRKIIICSDYEFRARKPEGSKCEVIVTLPENISGENNPEEIIKISACPIGSNSVNFHTHIIDNRNLKIMIAN